MAASSAHVFAMKARATRTRDIDEISPAGDIIGLNLAERSLTDMRGGLPGRTRIREVDVDPPLADPPLMAITPTSTSSASGYGLIPEAFREGGSSGNTGSYLTVWPLRCSHQDTSCQSDKKSGSTGDLRGMASTQRSPDR
jgi:hypothetical protein